MIIETGYPYNGLGRVISYEYDALDRPVAVHLPDGISTYKTYNARNQVTELTNQCDDFGWILGYYVYTYDDRGYIVAERTEAAPYGCQPHTPYKPDRDEDFSRAGEVHIRTIEVLRLCILQA